MDFSRSFLIAALCGGLAACSSSSPDRSSSTSGVGANDGTGANDDAGTGSGFPSRDGTSGDGDGSGDGQTGANCSETGPDDDADLDGFSPNQGDCNDCSAQINPGAYDFPDDEHDQDCSGTPAAAADDDCDKGLALDSTDPKDAARAMGLCKFTTEDAKDWGVISAKYTLADGTGGLTDAMQVGLLPKLGAAVPRAGASLLALSSGVARAPDQGGYTEKCDTFNAPADALSAALCAATGSCEGQEEPPPGFPKASSACGGAAGGSDAPIFNSVALELKVRVPTNVKSFSFESIFYSYEFPTFLCQQYNDFFIVLKEPLPENVPDGNIVFDSNGDPIGVNTGLLAVCDPKDIPSNAPPKLDCAQGPDLLKGTGFGVGEATCAQEGGTPDSAGGASTGWLKTGAPVSKGGVITIRFAIWDTGDAILDATALVDNFAWSVDDTEITTTPVVL